MHSWLELQQGLLRPRLEKVKNSLFTSVESSLMGKEWTTSKSKTFELVRLLRLEKRTVLFQTVRTLSKYTRSRTQSSHCQSVRIQSSCPYISPHQLNKSSTLVELACRTLLARLSEMKKAQDKSWQSVLIKSVLGTSLKSQLATMCKKWTIKLQPSSYTKSRAYSTILNCFSCDYRIFTWDI